MVKKGYIIALAAFLCMGITDVSGQKISGKIVDELGVGVEYVNVGVIGRPGGVVSDSQGNFSIMLPDSLDANDELSFSHLSYVSQHIKIHDIRHTAGAKQPISVVLESQNYRIEEIVVSGGKIKESTLLHKGFPIPGSVSPKASGCEIGSVIETDDCIRVSKIEFKTRRCSYENIRLRINIYRVEPDTFVNILHIPIYCDIPKSSKSMAFSIAPEEPLLLYKGRYFVSLEFVDMDGEGRISFPAFLRQSYIRTSSLAAFEELESNIGLSVKGYKISEK